MVVLFLKVDLDEAFGPTDSNACLVLVPGIGYKAGIASVKHTA